MSQLKGPRQMPRKAIKLHNLILFAIKTLSFFNYNQKYLFTPRSPDLNSFAVE
jgi:hypothetical protein